MAPVNLCMFWRCGVDKQPSARWLLVISLLIAGATLYLLLMNQLSTDSTGPPQQPYMDLPKALGFHIHNPGCRIPYMDPVNDTVKNWRCGVVKRPPARWLLFVTLLIAGVTLYLLLMNQLSTDSTAQPEQPYGDLPKVLGFQIHNSGCRIPYMDPLSDTVKKYLSTKAPIQCSDKPPLTASNQTSLWVIPDAAKIYGKKAIECCFRVRFRQKVPPGVGADQKIVAYVKCVKFNSTVTIMDEFIEVICTDENQTLIQKEYHAFIVPKRGGGSDSARATPGPSVLIIGVDAVSRLNFHRQMPKTLSYIKSLNATQYLGYNKVGDNTFPNLLGVLSGMSVDSIKNTCWTSKSQVFDDCPWIWKNFSNAGYKTGFGEDGTWMGLFNYFKPGFSQQPTDYFARVLMKSAEGNTGKRIGGKNVCVGSKFATELLLEYAQKFAVNMTGEGHKYWGLFWGCTMTHDYLNVLPNVDDLYHRLLVGLNSSSVLNNTVLFFMSDHGIRWGDIRETYQGRMEERLPFMFIVVPQWLREQHPTAMAVLARNRRALTSPFDLHETMLDLVNVSAITKEAIAARMERLKEGWTGGISWFLPIPEDRTCESAGIPEEWCTCRQSVAVPVADPTVARAAGTIVDHVVGLLAEKPQCARLHLHLVLEARKEFGTQNVTAETVHQFDDYVLQVETRPGGARLEATVRHFVDQDVMKVQGFVSRVNKYGTQGWCANDYKLQLYCYCM